MKGISIFVLLLMVALSHTIFAQKTIRDVNAEKRNASGFHAIRVSHGIDLYLSQGSESIAVSASDKTYRDLIVTEVKNGVLIIRYDRDKDKRKAWNGRKLKAYVSFKNLDDLEASGGSDIKVEGSIKVSSVSLGISGGSDFEGRVEADELLIRSSGGSDVDISGKVRSLTIDASGGSDVSAYSLESELCKIEASGGSDAEILVNKELNVSASGGSDISYRGNAVIKTIKAGGSSSVKKSKR